MKKRLILLFMMKVNFNEMPNTQHLTSNTQNPKSKIQSPIRVFSLASGSSGNSMLVQYGETNILIDAGLPIHRFKTLLPKYGVGEQQLSGVLMTHEHVDHSKAAGALSRYTNAPVFANRATLEAYYLREESKFSAQEFITGESFGVGDVEVCSFRVSHNAAEPVGFVLKAGKHTIFYCTDVGCPSQTMREELAKADLAILEANHDLRWLWNGPYSPSHKKQVASNEGHLSNNDCADLLAERLEVGGSLTIWLAHLSKANNSPALARQSVAQRIQSQTKTPFSLEIAMRDQPSLVWSSEKVFVPSSQNFNVKTITNPSNRNRIALSNSKPVSKQFQISMDFEE